MTRKEEGGERYVSKEKGGWGWPVNSRKAHYFVNGRALCGRWLFFGPLEQGNDDNPDNCAECKKRLKRRHRKLSAVQGTGPL